MQDDGNLYLGLDSSTQGLKAVLVNSRLEMVGTDAINFDTDLAEFETSGGAHHHSDGLTVTSPAIMWVAALDLLLTRMRDNDLPLGRIIAVSGSGQQHGSVWLNSSARAALRGLSPSSPLREQMESIFSVAESPIWMDSSTGKQCAEREAALGGAQAVAELTGSKAYERFTGNQIAKIYQNDPAAYGNTERIALVSSFMASLLLGDYAPIDASDGSGMNLMDLRSKTWSSAALDCTAPGLGEKLGEIVPSHTVVGGISQYYVARYGFSAECAVIAFSGDNPNSLAGLRLQNAGDVAISLGTSYTMFGSVADPSPSETEGHILANPVDPDGYMAMICYKNGSLTREHVRDEYVDGTWDGYRAALGRTPPGNNGYMGFYIREPEITPPILKTGIYRFDPGDDPVVEFPADVDARAVLETQFLSMRVHSQNVGLNPCSILATGGASADMGVVRVIADVFGKPISTAEVTDSAALGAAYRALHGWTCREKGEFVPFSAILATAPPFNIAVRPDTAANDIYNAMLDRFKKLEGTIQT